MADQFVGEIRIVPFDFAPLGWALCNGQLLAISQNTALFSLLGTYYGGNGTSNFALPNLQGSAPMNQGNGIGLTPRIMGEVGGETAVTLLVSQMPAHTHTAKNAAVWIRLDHCRYRSCGNKCSASPCTPSSSRKKAARRST